MCVCVCVGVRVESMDHPASSTCCVLFVFGVFVLFVCCCSLLLFVLFLVIVCLFVCCVCFVCLRAAVDGVDSYGRTRRRVCVVCA